MQNKHRKTMQTKLGKESEVSSKGKRSDIKPKKKKRLIIRNLSFQVTETELSDTFSQFGKVLNVTIPTKEDGRKRGFAFVEYEDMKSLIKAMKALNNKEIHGRRVAIDFAVDKTSYQLKLQSIKQEKNYSSKKNIDESSSSGSDDESEEEKPEANFSDEDKESFDEDEKRVNDFLKEFDSGFETVLNDDDDTSSESSNEESEDESEEKMSDLKKSSNCSLDYSLNSSKEKSSQNKRISHDVPEGKTVFIRNVSYSSSNESLKETLEKYGACEYCVICVDPITEHSKGTAFVKFKEKDSADKLIEESSNEPGILVDGRKLLCAHAISKDVILQHKDQQKKPKDKRNLNLLKVGLIMADSPESEEMSQPDKIKRSQLEIMKKQKLKNVNFFVSDKRLMIHNLPKTLTDAGLRKLFKQAAGRGAVITEARVMKEFSKTNAEGNPLSKGFGFVSFTKHEDALKALLELNNNPSTFNKQRRPIVEFSVENKVALLSKERRKEKIQMRNKRRTEEKRERQKTNNNKSITSAVKIIKKRKSETVTKEDNLESSNPTKKHKKVKNKKKSNTFSKTDEKSNTSDANNTLTVQTNVSEKKKKKQKRKSRKKNQAHNSSDNNDNFKNMVSKFKEKLLNKV